MLWPNNEYRKRRRARHLESTSSPARSPRQLESEGRFSYEREQGQEPRLKSHLLRCMMIIAIAFLVVAAKKPDRQRLRQIKSVAVIDFRVPWYVSDIVETTSVIGLVKAVRARDTEEWLNGDEVANEAVVGFVEGLADTGVFQVVDHRTVTENPVIRELVAKMPPEKPGFGSAVPAELSNCPADRLGRAARAAARLASRAHS